MEPAAVKQISCQDSFPYVSSVFNVEEYFNEYCELISETFPRCQIDETENIQLAEEDESKHVARLMGIDSETYNSLDVKCRYLTRIFIMIIKHAPHLFD